MPSKATTRQKILEQARELFNRQGYSSTTLAEIARAMHIAEGNLWYHFRTKKDLLNALIDSCREDSRANREQPSSKSLVDDITNRLVLAMRIQLQNRFLLRDNLQFSNLQNPLRLDPDLAADRQQILRDLRQMQKQGMLRDTPSPDIAKLANSLWILCRYWPDYLCEIEGVDDLNWKQQLAGIHHFVILLRPYLTAPAQKSFEKAFNRLQKSGEPQPLTRHTS